MTAMRSILNRIYGRRKGAAAYARLSAVLDAFQPIPAAAGSKWFSAADVILITYGDSLLRPGERPLQTLQRFCAHRFKGVFSGLHILPFFPYSSDDGFSVTDLHAVRPDLGTWGDIRNLGNDVRLMVDLVANHVSAGSRWFQSYLADETGFSELAVEVDPSVDLSGVTRPRALPLLTAYQKRSGRKVHVWTTFSADQIDLNYRSLDVLERMVRTLLFYASQGARIIRLDAIAYLWKAVGSACIHLPQTHDLVRLLRRILDLAAPAVILVTETNVPHAENISYFGDGYDEAQMVYNFTLPALLLYSLARGSAGLFSQWAQCLTPPSAQTAFFNFTASHDGIGVRPLEGIVPPSQIRWLADRVCQNGGRVSVKRNPDGSTSPYELNITYLDALKNPHHPDDPFQIARFLAAQAVALVLPGVPGVYIHSILGSLNWTDGVELTGRARTINRASVQVDALDAELADGRQRRARVFFPYRHMIRVRSRQPAFDPGAAMQILSVEDRVFAVKRWSAQQTLVALTNFCADCLTVNLSGAAGTPTHWDLLSGRRYDGGQIALAGYQSVWLAESAPL